MARGCAAAAKHELCLATPLSGMGLRRAATIIDKFSKVETLASRAVTRCTVSVQPWTREPERARRSLRLSCSTAMCTAPAAAFAAACVALLSVASVAGLPARPWQWDGVPAAAMIAEDGSVTIERRRAHQELLAANAFAAGEAAWGIFNDTSYSVTGWATLEIHTNPNMTDGQCATAAGMLEGKITANRIFQSAVNGGLGPGLKPQKAMSAFLDVNNQWIQMMAELSKQCVRLPRSFGASCCERSPTAQNIIVFE
eukprot:SAG31_NODE_108_length_24741_cov_6.933041_18_plen_255_part_00